jgi:hypothetical protein
VSVVDSLAVETSIETRTACLDVDRARAALAESLSTARAPRRSRLPTPSAREHWSVTVRIERGTASGNASAEAVIWDDTGRSVGRRTVTDRGMACEPLARAIGAWASLVLDAELVAEHDDLIVVPKIQESGGPSSRAADTNPTLPPSDSVPLTRPERTIEIGAMVYLRNGLTATGGVAGLAPFVTVEVARGWMLRPSAAFGRSTSPVPIAAERAVMASHVAARLDLCRRIPGNYVERRGIEADLCGGVDAGLVHSDGPDSAARLALGPSATLRGELGGGLALEVRGLVAANLLRESLFADEGVSLVVGSAELGLSMRLR